MSRILPICLLLLALSFSGTNAKDLICNSKADITNVRSGAGTNNPIAFTLGNMAEVEVLETETDSQGREWAKIAFREDGQLSEPEYGYVLRSSVGLSCGKPAQPDMARENSARSDKLEALKQKAAEGDVKAQLRLSRALESGGTLRGLGEVQKDEAEALVWLERAAENNDEWAQEYLSRKYLLGSGVDKDTTKALFWNRRAKATGGDAQSQFELAGMYVLAEGVPQDLAKAEVWFNKAADQGHEGATNTLIKMRRASMADSSEEQTAPPVDSASEADAKTALGILDTTAKLLDVFVNPPNSDGPSGGSSSSGSEPLTNWKLTCSIQCEGQSDRGDPLSLDVEINAANRYEAGEILRKSEQVVSYCKSFPYYHPDDPASANDGGASPGLPDCKDRY